MTWKPQPPGTYYRAAQSLVHLSAKITQSNALAAGVRLGPEAARALPYVSVQTLLAHGEVFDLDYVANSGALATVVKQIHAVAQGLTISALPPEEEDEIRGALKQANATAHTSGTAQISLRMRQLLLPAVQGGYVSFSPLGSGSLGRALRQKLREHAHVVKAQDAKTGRLRTPATARLPIGGANTQNVGAMARDLHRPLFFDAPQEDPQFKHALHLYYHGGSVRLPHKPMRQWRMANAAARLSNNLEGRTAEARAVQSVADAVLQFAANDYALLQASHSQLPGLDEQWLHESVTLLARGLLLAEARSTEWANLFAQHLAQAMAGYAFSDTQATLGLDQAALIQLQSQIRGTL